MDRNRVQGASIGRAGDDTAKSISVEDREAKNPATVHGRQLNLPQGMCTVSLRRLRPPRRSDRRAEVSTEGMVAGHVVRRGQSRHYDAGKGAVNDPKRPPDARARRTRGRKPRTGRAAS